MKSNYRDEADAGLSMAAGRANEWADRSRNALDDVASTASGLFDRGRGRAREAAGMAREWASDAADTLVDQSSRGLKTTTQFVRSQPLVALAATLVIGLVVGILLSRDD